MNFHLKCPHQACAAWFERISRGCNSVKSTIQAMSGALQVFASTRAHLFNSTNTLASQASKEVRTGSGFAIPASYFPHPFRSLRAIKASLSLAAQAILVRRHFALSTKVTGSGMEPRSSCCHGVYTSSRSTKPAIDPASEPAAKEEDVSSPNSTLERFEGSFICLGFSPQ